MTFRDQLYAIEDLADADLPTALADAAALDAQGPEEHAQKALMVGTLTARGGELGAAIEHLKHAATAAEEAGLALLLAEVRVTRASVHAALGEYDTALPMLRAQIQRLEAMPDGHELLRDAQAELAAYETLLGQ